MRRRLLAILLSHAGHPLTTDQLVDALWDERPPVSAYDNLHLYLHHIRRAVGPERLIRRGKLGYLLTMSRDELDMWRFTDSAAAARTAMRSGKHVRASRLVRTALSQWRGEPFAEFSDQPALRAEAERLKEIRLQAAEDQFDIDLVLGDVTHLTSELRPLIAAHPYRERFHEQLMMALYRSGRPAEALRAYHDARQVFITELGIEPGPRLGKLERAILDGTC